MLGKRVYWWDLIFFYFVYVFNFKGLNLEGILMFNVGGYRLYILLVFLVLLELREGKKGFNIY